MANNLLLNDVRMDTQTAFFANGDIKIYPCSYEHEKTPILPTERISYRGRITMMEDGNAEVKRYNLGSQPSLYKEIYATEHCTVTMSRGGQICECWKFKKNLSIHDIWAIRKREQQKVNAFFQTLK